MKMGAFLKQQNNFTKQPHEKRELMVNARNSSKAAFRAEFLRTNKIQVPVDVKPKIFYKFG